MTIAVLRPFALVAAGVFCLGFGPRELQEPVSAGLTAEGSLTLDVSTQHDHHRHGYQRISGRLDLDNPQEHEGREVTRIDIVHDWDCDLGQVREVTRTFRGDSGGYAGAEKRPGAWFDPGASPGLKIARRLVCPSWTRPAETATVTSPVVRRRRGPAQVVDMPSR